jgi:hypothetical protein
MHLSSGMMTTGRLAMIGSLLASLALGACAPLDGDGESDDPVDLGSGTDKADGPGAGFTLSATSPRRAFTFRCESPAGVPCSAAASVKLRWNDDSESFFEELRQLHQDRDLDEVSRPAQIVVEGCFSGPDDDFYLGQPAVAATFVRWNRGPFEVTEGKTGSTLGPGPMRCVGYVYLADELVIEKLRASGGSLTFDLWAWSTWNRTQ